jgi:Na+-translocating ferredoxin:NAD+ oxidoreductase RnfC subunit
MTRTILAFVTAFLAVTTVFASAAEACISCEHVPVVARSSPPSASAKRYTKKRVNRSTKKRKARAAEKRIVKRKTTAKKRIVKRKTTAEKRIVKRKITAKKVETAKNAPIKSETDNQNSTIPTASLDNNAIVETKVMPEDEPKTSSYGGCMTNGKTLSVGCVVAEAGPRHEPKMTENLGCRRFFPTVGMTLTVPCE